eukprot:TRINITY_DN1038_c0_g1_i1.p1 TRINITY_DN1038_c0_g1~~TRINITY_DN1038_c0_g1_i1.p1  ORF type:complete len:417 (-),score=169.71 TRINITY_DN1038_c0_g1_i1:30-1196(-)
MFLYDEEAVILNRTCGSVPGLFPLDIKKYFWDEHCSFAYLRDDKTNKMTFNCLNTKQLLTIGGSERNMIWFDKYYANSYCFGVNPKSVQKKQEQEKEKEKQRESEREKEREKEKEKKEENEKGKARILEGEEEEEAVDEDKKKEEEEKKEEKKEEEKLPLEEEEMEVLKAPPVKRLTVIYGINIDTEVFYFYKRNKRANKDLIPIKLDLKSKLSYAADRSEGYNYVVRGGIGYETKETKQKFIQFLTGEEVKKSGDATVPYCSLAYPLYWKQDQRNAGLEIEIHELEGAEHREILKDERAIKLVLKRVCGQEEEGATKEDESVKRVEETAAVEVRHRVVLDDAEPLSEGDVKHKVELEVELEDEQGTGTSSREESVVIDTIGFDMIDK